MRPGPAPRVQRGCETRAPSGSAPEVRQRPPGDVRHDARQPQAGQEAGGQDVVHRGMIVNLFL